MPRAHTLPQILRHLFPYLSATDMQGLPPTPQVLIAGCGTGKQPIEQAMLLKPAQFTAIDLSRSSLAYAQYKTQGYGLEDQITYAQADILHLPETGKMYDVIYCGGVLHHMRDPLQGWRALQCCLKPGGFMMVALYSARARRFVTKAREWIAQENFPPTIEGIRTCREAIKAMPPDDPRRPQVLWADFYSTSSCRDLLFHVQEHLSNPADLKTTLNTLGLEFLGFQHQDMGLLARYRAANPQDPWGRDLALWDSFEAQNPDIFRAMMHIWVRKKV
jgi:SAM-dependent methyltransferase